MHARPLCRWLLSTLAPLLVPLGCGAPADSSAPDTLQQAQDNQPAPESEPDRCTVSSDRTGDNLGEGTVDANGFCCVPQSNGSQNCYACGSGYTCSSIPSRGPRPPIFNPPPGPPVKR
jgi:hypothetical protein